MLNEEIFTYSRELDREVYLLVRESKRFHRRGRRSAMAEEYMPDMADFRNLNCSCFCNFIEAKEKWKPLLKSWTLPEILFYACANIFDDEPREKVTTGADLDLLVANLAVASLENEQAAALYVGGLPLLGSAFLLLSCQNEWHVTLGRRSDINETLFERLLNHLREFFPSCSWQDEHKLFSEPTVVLDCNFKSPEPDMPLFQNAAKVAGGVFYSSAAFMGVQRYDFIRESWVKSGLLSSIVQTLPLVHMGRPFDPIFFELGNPARERPLRMINLQDEALKAGSFNMRAFLNLVSSRFARPGISIDVPFREVVSQGQYILAPKYYLAATLDKKASPGSVLRGRGLVLRCQIQREKISKLEEMPVIENGSMLAREVSLLECDSITGFVDTEAGNLVKLPFDKNSANSKYLLQEKDIILAFRGTANSVGQTGFVEHLAEPAVAGLSMCIIRALPGLDPVWLYYYLRSPAVLAYIRGKAFGSSLVNVNSSLLQDLPLALPGASELEEIHRLHARLAANSAKISTLRADNRKILTQMPMLEE